MFKTKSNNYLLYSIYKISGRQKWEGWNHLENQTFVTCIIIDVNFLNSLPKFVPVFASENYINTFVWMYSQHIMYFLCYLNINKQKPNYNFS